MGDDRWEMIDERWEIEGRRLKQGDRRKRRKVRDGCMTENKMKHY